jgi:hypothetical protein
MTYDDFLASKRILAVPCGFDVREGENAQRLEKQENLFA